MPVMTELTQYYIANWLKANRLIHRTVTQETGHIFQLAEETTISTICFIPIVGYCN